MMEERETTCMACVHEELSSKEATISLDICELTASWTETTSDPTLNDVSFSAIAGEIVAIVGAVGCGKVKYCLQKHQIPGVTKYLEKSEV